MNTQDRIWTILNKIHELKLIISTEDINDYGRLYSQLYILEKELEDLNDERN